MSKTVHIGSATDFDSLIRSSTIVVTDCKCAIHPTCPIITHSLRLSALGCIPHAARVEADIVMNQSMRTGVHHASRSPPYTNNYQRGCHGPTRSPSRRSTSTNKKKLLRNIASRRKYHAVSQAQTSFLNADGSLYSMPTFMIFKNAQIVSTIRGADPRKLSEAVQKLAAEADSDGSATAGGFGEAGASSGGGAGDTWLGATLPKGYGDVTDQVDVKGLDLLNSDTALGDARTLFATSKPSGRGSTSTADGGKGKGKAGNGEGEGGSKADWVESDTDEQLMLYVPFRSTLKVHTIHITSLPPKASEDGDGDDDEVPMRPKTIQVYSNRAHVLGFEEAEDIPATQRVTLGPRDWDEKTGTAKIELRFVKFQNVTSLVIFVVDGNGDGEKVRVDRLRIVGETGEKRDLGKLEKIGDEQGE